MVVRLTIQNNVAIPVVINSDSATGQPLLPNQSVQVMGELREGRDGIAELHLYIDPAR